MKFIRQFFAGLIFVASLFPGSVDAQIQIKAEPNEVIPKVIYISNDSLSMTISLNDRLEVSSLKYLPA